MSPESRSADLLWYGEGLRFSCTRCGLCCQGEGYVWVERLEIRRLARFLGLSVVEFGQRYLRRVDGRLSLTEAADGSCVFFDEGCTVYPERPTQCRTFPFWKKNVGRPERWLETAEQCEGIGEGRRYSHDEIVRLGSGLGEAEEGPA